ncbi:MAG: hypothetical protein KatS3mg111_0918 [Pirellulaceae bacterium]|nr:MAG: hypothetical protein KatS3mg111_0918 [Pirellulaceae bacterium]
MFWGAVSKQLRTSKAYLHGISDAPGCSCWWRQLFSVQSLLCFALHHANILVPPTNCIAASASATESYGLRAALRDFGMLSLQDCSAAWSGRPCEAVRRLAGVFEQLSQSASLARQVQASREFGRSPGGTVAWRQRPRKRNRNTPPLAEGQIHWRGGRLGPEARRRILDNTPAPCQAPTSTRRLR